MLFIDDTEQRGDFFLSYILVNNVSSVGSGQALDGGQQQELQDAKAIPVTVCQALSLQDTCPWAGLGTPSSLCVGSLLGSILRVNMLFCPLSLYAF